MTDNTQAELYSHISDNRFNRFDDELINKYFNKQGKQAIAAYTNKQIEAVLDRLANTLTGSNDFRVEPSAKLYLSVGQIITIRSTIEVERNKLKESK